MDNLEILMRSLSQIMLVGDISPRETDLFQRVLMIKAGILPYSGLWGGRNPLSPDFIFENSQDPKKIDIRFCGSNDDAEKLLNFLKINCDPNATLQNDSLPKLTMDFDLVQTRLLPYFQILINAMVKDRVPELTPHRYLSECDPVVLKKRYKYEMGMNNPNNPFGLVMKEIDDNVAKLGISICTSQLMEYSLLLLVGERNGLFEKKHQRTVPIEYIDPWGINFDLMDRGWGLYYKYSRYYWEELILFTPGYKGENINFEISLKSKGVVEKIASYLAPLCKINITERTNDYGHKVSYAAFTISTKDYYEKVLPKFKEFITGMVNSDFPELYENLKAISQGDPDVQRLQNSADKSWKSIPINFPENKTEEPKKPKNDSSKNKNHCGFFNGIKKKINSVLNAADCCVEGRKFRANH